MEKKEKTAKKPSKRASKKTQKERPKIDKKNPFVTSKLIPLPFTGNSDNKTNDNNNKEKIIENNNNKIDSPKEKVIPLLNSPFYDELPFISDRARHSESNDHISQSINKLKTGDDTTILNELISLCDFLALSSDRIGYNPNMKVLLEQICNNLSKTYSPEIVIYSLQCLNHILDINPGFAFDIRRYNAVPSIMKDISCIGDITFMEYVIKVFERISNENSRILLENNVFVVLLSNVFDFMNSYQKKSIMKICYNIASKRNNITEYNTYIKPALNILLNLFKIEEGDNADNIFIVENIGKMLYFIIDNIINYSRFDDFLIKKIELEEKDKRNYIDELITNYNILEKYMDILNNYFIKKSKNITDALIKNILNTIILILGISKIGLDKFLSYNFLVIFSDIINNDFRVGIQTNNNINDNNNINNINENNNINNINNINNAGNNNNKTNIHTHNSHTGKGIVFINEFFKISISLFPTLKNKDENNKKILSDENRKYYDFFCQKIFLPLIKCIINKSTNKVLADLTKLVLVFIDNANVKDITLYLPSKEISKIIIKLLNSKLNSSIVDSIRLIKSLLEKSPENYIVNFIREGVVHNLKNYKFEKKVKIEKNYDKNHITLFPNFGRRIKQKKEYKINFLDSKEIDKNIIDNKYEDKDKEDKYLSILDANSIDSKDSIINNNYNNKNNNNINIPKIDIKEGEKYKEKDKKTKREKKNYFTDLFLEDDNEKEFQEDEEIFNEDNNNEEIEESEKSPKKEEFDDFEEEESDFMLFKKRHKLKQKEKEKDTEKLNDIIKIDSEKEKEAIKQKEIKPEFPSILESSEIKDLDERNKFEKFLFDKNLLRRKKRRAQRDMFHRMKYDDIDDNIYSVEQETIQMKIKDLLEKELTEEKIALYLSKTENKTKDSLIKIQTTLSNYQKLLSPACESNEKDKDNKKIKQYLKEIVDILTDENISVTSFELENSKIFLSLCNYFDNQFNKQYDKLIDEVEYKSIDKLINDLDNKNLVPEKMENGMKIIENLKNFFSVFIKGDNIDKNKLNSFIKLLNESIQNLNIPIFALIDDNRSFYNDRFIRRESDFYIKVNYDEKLFKESILNRDIIIDNINYKNKVCELNTFFLSHEKIPLKINDNFTFKKMSLFILSLPNIPLITDDKYDINFKFFIDNDAKNNINKDINDSYDMFIDDDEEDEIDYIKNEKNNNTSNINSNINNNISNNININKSSSIEIKKEENNKIFDIDINWTYKQFLEKYSQKNNNSKNVPFINFGISIKLKDEQVNSKEIKINCFMENYSSFVGDLNFGKFIYFDKFNFMKDYYDNIIANKGLYFSKHLMPFLYLISLLHLCLCKYRDLFGMSKLLSKDNENNIRIDWPKTFLNLKIEQFIIKLMLDSYKPSNSSFPILGKYLSESKQFFTKFGTRNLCFKGSFTPKYKSKINIGNFLKNKNPNNFSKESVTLKKSMRLKINVDRDKIIESGFKILNDEYTSKFQGYLEYEYKGEIGNGIGPTLEFYTLIIDKIKEDEDLWYKTTDKTLYPKLLNNGENNDKILKTFKLLGYMIGRAIYDDRLFDIPLNFIFWELILDRPVLFFSVRFIDNCLYKTLLDFVNLIKRKKDYIKKNNIIINIEDINFDDIILYNNCKLSELDIYFIFPGYNNIELKPNGNDILLTMNNIEEYVNLIYDFLFYRGVDLVIKSFKEGFNLNFNIEELKCFSSYEISEFICGSTDKKWDEKVLYENVKPDHGYTNKSRIFNDLIKFMSNLDKNNRRKFLIFTTGCSRLPIGGFKALSPKLTVVKKHCDEENDPDDYLPTVMTCQNYLKIPEYSSFNVLEKKILVAMNEGCNEFNLS